MPGRLIAVAAFIALLIGFAGVLRPPQDHGSGATPALKGGSGQTPDRQGTFPAAGQPEDLSGSWKIKTGTYKEARGRTYAIQSESVSSGVLYIRPLQPGVYRCDPFPGPFKREGAVLTGRANDLNGIPLVRRLYLEGGGLVVETEKPEGSSPAGRRREVYTRIR